MQLKHQLFIGRDVFYYSSESVSGDGFGFYWSLCVFWHRCTAISGSVLPVNVYKPILTYQQLDDHFQLSETKGYHCARSKDAPSNRAEVLVGWPVCGSTSLLDLVHMLRSSHVEAGTDPPLIRDFLSIISKNWRSKYLNKASQYAGVSVLYLCWTLKCFEGSLLAL